MPYSFPPCAADLKANVHREQRVSLHSRSILLINENFFGPQFEPIHRILMGSAYTGDKCTQCGHHKNGWCKGMYSRTVEEEAGNYPKNWARTKWHTMNRSSA